MLNRNYWYKDEVQFARLICEADALGLFTEEVIENLEIAMGLDSVSIIEIISRAELSFGIIKKLIIKEETNE